MTEQERAVPRRASSEEQRRYGKTAQETGRARMRTGEPSGADESIGHQDPGPPHEPRRAVAPEEDVVEAVGALEIEDEQAGRERQEEQRDDRRHDADQKARGGDAQQRGESRDQHHAGRDRLRPQVRRDLPAPRTRDVRCVIHRTAQPVAVLHLLNCRHHADEIDVRRRTRRERVVFRLRLHGRRERGGIRAEIEDFG